MPTPTELTARQAEILAFVRDTLRTRNASPSVHEIGQRFGIHSPNGVHTHLRALEKKGRLKLGGGKHRAIRLPGPVQGGFSLPIRSLDRIKSGPARIPDVLAGRTAQDRAS